jgi:endonuclease YncB( thermonuclease family)
MIPILKKTGIIALIIILLPTLTWAINGKVISVSDGDTIKILTKNNQQFKVRLYGFDCPEKGEAFGNCRYYHCNNGPVVFRSRNDAMKLDLGRVRRVGCDDLIDLWMGV